MFFRKYFAYMKLIKIHTNQILENIDDFLSFIIKSTSYNFHTHAGIHLQKYLSDMHKFNLR